MTKYFLELGAKVAIIRDLEKLKKHSEQAETGGTCLLYNVMFVIMKK
jgi:hypothetical protein